MVQSFKIFLFYHGFPIQQYYFVWINQDIDLQGEVSNEPNGLILENGHQETDSEGSNNYTLVPTHSAMPPQLDNPFQTREELASSAKLHAAGHGYALVNRTLRPGKLWLK